MNQFSSSACRSRVILVLRQVRLGWLLLAFSFLASQPVFGTDDFWTGAQDQRGSNPNNWLGGAIPGAGDNAVFNRQFPNQPIVDVSGTVGGIWMTVGIGQNVSIGGTNVLTLGGNTINGTGGLGILVDNTNAFTLTINAPIALGAAQAWMNSSANVLTIGAVNTNTFALTVNGSGGTTISGAVSGTGTITKTGNGTLTLSGANTYSGATTLTSGTLNINNATALGSGTNAFSINGGTIDNTTAGSITMTKNNPITFGGNFTFGGTQNLTFGTGAITNAGNRSITLNGTNSTLTFGGTMTNTSNAVQTTTVNGAGNTLSLGGYALSNNATSRIDVINGTGKVTITGAVTNGGTAIASGLTYSGSGTLTLSGTNTYKGATTVNSGTLLVNGNNSSATGAVSVNNVGTTLGGTGTIGGAVTVGNGAILRGGTGSTASGTLTLANNLTLSSGSIIELALGASGAHSTLARTGGAWSLNAIQAFTFINLGAQPGNYANIITGLASDPGSENSWTITDTGWIGTFSYSGGDISLNVVAVPEPSTWMAGALALGSVGWTQRRRFSRALKCTCR